MKEIKCPGERTAVATGTGVASYESGFRLSFAALLARFAAGDAADTLLAADLVQVKQAVCLGLCPEGCRCIPRAKRVRFFDGYSRVDFVPRTTILGFSFGGTFTVTKQYEVFGECFRVQPLSESVAPVSASGG